MCHSIWANLYQQIAFYKTCSNSSVVTFKDWILNRIIKTILSSPWTRTLFISLLFAIWFVHTFSASDLWIEFSHPDHTIYRPNGADENRVSPNILSMCTSYCQIEWLSFNFWRQICSDVNWSLFVIKFKQNLFFILKLEFLFFFLTLVISFRLNLRPINTSVAIQC